MDFIRLVILGAALSALTACGGGGGSETTALVETPAEAPVVVEPETPSETVSTLAATVAEVGLSVDTSTNISNGGNVSLAIDENFGITVDSGTTSIRFDERNRTFFAIFAGFTVEDETDLTVIAIPGNDPASLTYATYGFWAESDDPGLIDGDSEPVQGGTFFGGNTTPIESMPSTGTATYNGFAVGNDGAASDAGISSGEGLVAGTSTFTADFAQGSLTGQLNLSNAEGEAFADVDFSNVAISANTFEGDAASTIGHGGTMRGQFFGPAADELAGLTDLSGPTTLSVSFGAAQ